MQIIDLNQPRKTIFASEITKKGNIGFGYTPTEAEDQAYQMDLRGNVNCTNCVDCSDCINCHDCEKCQFSRSCLRSAGLRDKVLVADVNSNTSNKLVS